MRPPLISTIILSLFAVLFGHAQNHYEREYRIKKSQFPEKALTHLDDRLENARRIRYYREIDGTNSRYEIHFKKDRLKYSVAFDNKNNLEGVEIEIRSVDIPNDSFSKIIEYLSLSFRKYRIRKIQQYYSADKNDIETTLKNAFQNLLLPSLLYKLIISGKKTKNYGQYDILFDAQGGFVKIRKSLPPNYDHVLY
ncbi:hypothetical protein [Pareuzebyella sediminis]|uniref:hypothetical protein n=1 Tax=Pareuzebyella sediminis TaxID=2607998 RepID=UPI0011ED4548|nr:hypothetical protein [Pareuzebyella sediminis]